MYDINGNTMRISVRNLVEFMCASGDIDNRNTGIRDVKVMQEGARIHRKIQKSMGSDYHPEVPLKYTISMISEGGIQYEVAIEGRADGIIADIEENEDGDKIPVTPVIVDEIKTVQTDVSNMREAVYVHKAQAYVYGYIYLKKHNLEEITIQLTYCNPETEEIQRFSELKTKEEIYGWFDSLMEGYKRWSDFLFDERKIKIDSISGLEFPFQYREGQKKLVSNVYKAIEGERTLFIQAPTGVGKTISTVYPAVQSCSHGHTDKIFYLTSKTITRTVAEDTYNLLREKGLHFRTVTLTARDKICHLDQRNCNPVACPYAKGHFDRVNDCVYDIITHEQVINADKVTEYSIKHQVCPFEMSLDVSYWCDGIICDYNYVFDPDASLKRYFGEGSKGDYVFLVDEAHNLVERAREMYSATVVKEHFLECKKKVKDMDKALYNALEKCNKDLLALKRQCNNYMIIDNLSAFPVDLQRCYSLMEKFMDKHKGKPVVDDILDFFFEIRHFLNMYDCLDEKYIIYADHDEETNFCLHLYCANPSGNISLRMNQGISTIFFSATLLPVNYFKEMLSGDEDDSAVYAHSPFNPDNKRVIVARDVTSRYTRRNRNEYEKISDYIHSMAVSKQGNYMVFFPSYSFMKSVYDIYTERYPANLIDIRDTLENGSDAYISSGTNVIMQSSGMGEKEKENFLELFKYRSDATLIGFCVLGGIFSEGIDLKEDSLIGAAIVGTGIPMICKERDILRKYFDDWDKNGYEYAYVFPGMNKVLQAAGRVIRTDTDRGVILLLDDRFMTKEYQLLYPREWNMIYPVNVSLVEQSISEFWNTD